MNIFFLGCPWSKVGHCHCFFGMSLVQGLVLRVLLGISYELAFVVGKPTGMWSKGDMATVLMSKPVSPSARPQLRFWDGRFCRRSFHRGYDDVIWAMNEGIYSHPEWHLDHAMSRWSKGR